MHCNQIPEIGSRSPQVFERQLGEGGFFRMPAAAQVRAGARPAPAKAAGEAI